MDILFIRSIFCEKKVLKIDRFLSRRKDYSQNILSTWTFRSQEYVHMKIRGPNSVNFVQKRFLSTVTTPLIAPPNDNKRLFLTSYVRPLFEGGLNWKNVFERDFISWINNTKMSKEANECWIWNLKFFYYWILQLYSRATSNQEQSYGSLLLVRNTQISYQKTCLNFVCNLELGRIYSNEVI